MIANPTGDNTRSKTLLSSHRREAGRYFDLRLHVNPDDARRGISFEEEYEYMSRPGDGGGEYRYVVHTPYSSLPALVRFFESRTGRVAEPSEDLEDRLTACMALLVERGDLEDGIAIKENRDRVAGWFTEAGVPTESDESHWFSMDGMD
ncbi:hypothetical protein [Rhizohabitans arisaemae]|uniref:hypothetical protein n=1 Tax=Rhizohabitans arisaemae TaxID=2720610 RepID=UPI0024B0F204|nr:hypothetical protein [Rhizohabitans arisaemae]